MVGPQTGVRVRPTLQGSQEVEGHWLQLNLARKSKLQTQSESPQEWRIQLSEGGAARNVSSSVLLVARVAGYTGGNFVQ